MVLKFNQEKPLVLKSEINFCAIRGLYNTCVPHTAPTRITNATQVPCRLSGSEHLSKALCH